MVEAASKNICLAELHMKLPVKLCAKRGQKLNEADNASQTTTIQKQNQEGKH